MQPDGKKSLSRSPIRKMNSLASESNGPASNDQPMRLSSFVEGDALSVEEAK